MSCKCPGGVVVLVDSCNVGYKHYLLQLNSLRANLIGYKCYTVINCIIPLEHWTIFLASAVYNQ